MAEVNGHRWNPGAALLVLALALPMLSPWQWPPIVQFSNQLMAAGLWTLTVLVWVGYKPKAERDHDHARAGWLMAVFWLALAVAVPASRYLNDAPLVPALPVSGLLLLALAVGLRVGGLEEPSRTDFWRSFCVGLILAGLGSVLIALLQAWLPPAPGRFWLLPTAEDGRASAHLLQPNHLASLLLLAMIAIWALEIRPWWVGWLMQFGLALTLLATASRTGLVLLAALSALALRHSARSAGQRAFAWALAALSLLTILAYVLVPASLPESWRQRWLLWQDVASLIAAKPWAGHGFGQLNAVWTLSPFPNRPPDVFDHAHNLPLQLAVELGLPVAVLLLVLLGVILWHGRAALRDRRGQAVAAMLAVLLMHSLVEYPLWYAYFLLPAAALLGLWQNLGTRAPGASARPWHWASRGLSLTVILGLLVAIVEYGPIARLHERAGHLPPKELSPWVEQARQSRLFGHLGDYAAIMLAGDEARLEWFARPLAYRIDEPLLAAYARALVRAGRQQEAQAVIARAREFPPHPAWASLPRLPALPELKRE